MDSLLRSLASNDATLAASGKKLNNMNIAKLAAELKANTTTVKLLLNGNHIGVTGAEHLGASLATNTTLESLVLSDNKICDLSTARLAGGLRANATLRRLDLDGNLISSDGVGSLAAALRTDGAALRVLSLNKNEVDDDGAVCLADVLRVNGTIEELWLGQNMIGDDGATQLADALRTNTSLEVLTLSNNEIGDEGATELAGALRVNTTLLTLQLDSNEIGDEGVGELLGALRDKASGDGGSSTKATLEFLEIFGNPLSDVDAAEEAIGELTAAHKERARTATSAAAAGSGGGGGGGAAQAAGAGEQQSEACTKAAHAAAAEAALQRQAGLLQSGGWLEKQAQGSSRTLFKNWKRRHMQLESHGDGAVVLAYFEAKGGAQKGEFVLQAAGAAGSGRCRAAEVRRDDEVGFRVLSGGRTFRLRAATAAEADDWVAVLGLGAAAIAERCAALHQPADDALLDMTRARSGSTLTKTQRGVHLEPL